MKKLFWVLVLAFCLALSMGQSALANDGEAMYKRACAGCHGQNGQGSSSGSGAIKGKSTDDVQRILHGYKDGTYGGRQKNVMMNVAKQLSDDHIKNLGDYIATFK